MADAVRSVLKGLTAPPLHFFTHGKGDARHGGGMTNNYFAVNGTPFFFNDQDPQSTHTAWEAARAHSAFLPKARIAIYRPMRDNPRTMYVIGESPDVPVGHEVTAWRPDGWTSRLRNPLA